MATDNATGTARPTYTVEPGRHIHRDGVPFVYIGRVDAPHHEPGKPNAYVSPTDCDTFTRDAVRAVNAHDKLVEVVATMLGAAEVDALDDKSNVWRSAMVDARAALTLAQEGE